ncbi:MAG: hypothetical protein DWQ18_04800 [Crenarchaeota archaeon]|nr:MAG: hypothetical protein DWQ17_08330 [Thermoproteota archaeon]RDJ34213.1 MAG: hypothetical protein DWQ18_04800 [Thermoproteota archaeon]RDJ36673.1 MAG: hypothetical protein DWQ13_05810 [Thermoproteota archaeon]RDJ37796.1 MAG: hypothetical protein DWQ19_05025 [Thermoproteota archaeon]
MRNVDLGGETFLKKPCPYIVKAYALAFVLQQQSYVINTNKDKSDALAVMLILSLMISDVHVVILFYE